jgi:hypothetical protein
VTGFDISKLLDIRKVPLWVWAAAALTSGVVLFVPPELAGILGFVDLRANHRAWVGTSFVLGASALVIRGGWSIWTKVRTRFEYRKRRQRRIASLAVLSPLEKGVLKRYVQGQTKSQYLLVSDGVTRSLEHAQIIYRAANISKSGMSFAYNLQPWAWKYLNEHPELLEGGVEQSADDDWW